MSYSSLHLVKRGRNYYFRRAIPDDLAKLLVCREIKVSLRTSDAIRGRIRARYLSSTLDLAFRDLRQMTAISNDVIYERAKDYFRKRLSKSLEHAFLLPREEDWDRHKKFLDLIAANAKTPDQKKAFESYLRKRAGYPKRTYLAVAKYVLIGIVVCLGLTLLFLVVYR